MRVGSRVEYVGDHSPGLDAAIGTLVGIDKGRPAPHIVQFDHMETGSLVACLPGSLEEMSESRIDSINDAWKGTTEEQGFDWEPYEPIVAEAQRLVYGDRNADYGHPYDDYIKNAAFLTQILKRHLKDDAVITPQDVCIFMITLKVSRLINDPYKRDSIVDVAGYAECLSRINRREAGLE